MSGTKEGGAKCAETNKTKYGSDYYQRIGAMGGKKSKTGGTYGRPDWASKIGSIGGRRSKRGYRFIKESEQGLHYVDNTTGKVVIFNHGRTLENH